MDQEDHRAKKYCKSADKRAKGKLTHCQLKILVVVLIILSVVVFGSYTLYLAENKYSASSTFTTWYDWIYEIFEEHKTFEYDVWFEDPLFLLDTTFVTARFNGEKIGGLEPYKNPNLSILEHVGGIADGKLRCNHALQGWFDEQTKVEIEVYYYNPYTKDSYLYETQTLLITPGLFGYGFEVIEFWRNETFDWSVVKTVAEG